MQTIVHTYKSTKNNTKADNYAHIHRHKKYLKSRQLCTQAQNITQKQTIMHAYTSTKNNTKEDSNAHIYKHKK